MSTAQFQGLSDEDTQPHLLFSEAVTAASLALPASKGVQSPYQRAAELLARLRRVHAAGQVPGLPATAAEARGRSADEKLFAAFLWLLAERGEDLRDEDQLLKMAYAMTRTLWGDSDRQRRDSDAIAAAFERLAEHL